MQAIIPDCSMLISIRDSDLFFSRRNLDVLIFYTSIHVITNSSGFHCSYLLSDASLNENQFTFNVILLILRLIQHCN